MTLYYPELNHDKTIQIFELNLELIKDRFRRMKRKIEIDHKGIDLFARMHFWYYHDSRWNGRQIHNACQTALALAEYQAQPNSNITELDLKPTVHLTVEHFEVVRDAYLDFTKYMNDLYGANTSHIAEEKFLRAKEMMDQKKKRFLTTEQINEEYNEIMSQRPRPPIRRDKTAPRLNHSETDNDAKQYRPRQAQSTNLMYDRNQTELSPPRNTRRRLLRSQKSTQPYPTVQQQYFSQPSEMEREPIQRFRSTGQRRKEQREKQPRQQFEDFQENDDDEYSEMLHQEQEVDDVSYDEEEEGNGYDSGEEQSIPVITRGKRGQDGRRSGRKGR